jgi:hypothetical protein
VFIPDPDFYTSQSPDPTKETKEGENFWDLSFLEPEIYINENYFIFEQVKIILLAISLKIIVLFTEKIGSGILDPRFRIRDPGSDIQDPEKKLIPDPGVKKAPDPEHRMLRGTSGSHTPEQRSM